MAIVTVIPGTFTTPGLPTLGVLGFTDTFNRPDASTLGHTEGMPRLPWQAWASGETTEVISGGEASIARTSGGPCSAVVNGHTADGTVELTLGGVAGSQSGVVFRGASPSDYWRFVQAGAVYRLYKIIATAAATVGESSGITPASGDALRVVLAGNSIACYVNGVEVAATSSPDLSDATHCGFFNQGTTSNTMRDIKVTA